MIGLWTSSSPAPAADVTRGIKALGPFVDALVFPEASRKWAARKESAARPFLAGPDAAKVQALVSLLQNPDVSDILAVRGGYGTLRLLPLLEKVGVFRLPAKRIWGYSDLTSLQMAYWGRTGASWVHAPMLSSLSLAEPRGLESRTWREAFAGSEGSQTHALRVLESRRTSPGKKSRSLRLPMVGGNLACLNALVGTPWEPKPRPCLLFLEEVNEAAYRIDRMLQQLAASAFFKQVRGIVLGHFTGCSGYKAVLQLWARERALPLFSGLKAGHERPNLPIVLGETVLLEYGSQKTAKLTMPKPRFGC
jgi:muramoyltetrapeptide carboxypeptidase